MGLATILARRSLLQRPGRTLFSILGIAVGIATVVGIFTLDHNTLIMRSQEDDPEWQAEIEVSPSAGVTKPREDLTKVAGVSDVTAAFQAQASLWTDETEGERRCVGGDRGAGAAGLASCCCPAAMAPDAAAGSDRHAWREQGLVVARASLSAALL